MLKSSMESEIVEQASCLFERTGDPERVALRHVKGGNQEIA
jgi:hypothetical protein